MKHLTQFLQFLFITLTIFLFPACTETCHICENDVQCSNSQICLNSEPHMNMCAQTCSLTVWHDGEGYDAPCKAGINNCPETCQDQNGIFGHCTFHEGLPEDVGICIIETGDLVCI